MILEIGSGAGKFTEIFLKHGAYVVSIEPSSAIYANYHYHKSENLLLIKQRLEDLPLNNSSFDFVFCYGLFNILQDPKKVIWNASNLLSQMECAPLIVPEKASSVSISSSEIFLETNYYALKSKAFAKDHKVLHTSLSADRYMHKKPPIFRWVYSRSDSCSVLELFRFKRYSSRQEHPH